MNFVEIENFGLNTITITFFATIVFNFIAIWGLWCQNKKIWNKKSGTSVSITWMSYFTFLFVANFIYGIDRSSLALILNGALRTPMHIPILIGLWKFKGFRKSEQALFLALILLSASMVFVPAKDWFYLIFCFGSIASLVVQPLEIWKNKTSGVAAIQLFAVYLPSSFFWIVYAFAIDDWALKIIATSYFILYVITIILWLKYKTIEKKTGDSRWEKRNREGRCGSCDTKFTYNNPDSGGGQCQICWASLG